MKKSTTLAKVPKTAGMTFCHATVPTQEDCISMTAENLHTVLLNSLSGYLVNGITAKHAVTAAKLKMQNGEAVGGCLKFTTKDGYVDTYLRDKENGQTLTAAVRYFYRLLDGVGIDTKYDSSESKKKRKELQAAKEKEAEKRKKDKEAKTARDARQKLADAKKQKTASEIIEADNVKLREKITKLETLKNVAPSAIKPSPVSISRETPQEKDTRKIHANELVSLESTLAARDKSLKTLSAKYAEVYEEAIHLAKLGTQAQDGEEKVLGAIVKLATAFVKKHGEAVAA
jgi:hypothetical protein